MTVILETERLFLRELLLNDVEPLTVILSNDDPRVIIYAIRKEQK